MAERLEEIGVEINYRGQVEVDDGRIRRVAASREVQVPRAPARVEDDTVDDAPTTPPTEPRPAGFVRRALATVVDMVVFLGLSFALLSPAVHGVDWAVASEGIDRLAREVSQPRHVEHMAAAIGMFAALSLSMMARKVFASL